MTVLILLALGVHALGGCSSGVHLGTSAKICENSLASWSAVASPRDTAFGRQIDSQTAIEVWRRCDLRKRCPINSFTNPQLAAPKSVEGGSAFANPPIFHCFCNFQEKQLSARSRLMGGQFPLKKEFGAFKNPLFFDNFRSTNRPKIELSFLMLQNSLKIQIFHTFSRVYTKSEGDS